jgi:beta-1,4-N-acetylglucosaminyltransferase
MRAQRVFLTVGTTSFDSLIEAVDTEAFLEVMRACGCQELVLQIGRGSYLPSKYLTVEKCSQHSISFEYFRFKPTLTDEMTAADLIISHCGAGSVLEAVTLKKILLVVVNDTLQENHQEELADAMANRKHCLKALPADVVSVLEGLAGRLNSNSDRDGDSPRKRDTASVLRALALEPYPEADLDAFPAAVDSLFSF